MYTLLAFDTQAEGILDSLGAEPLAGSGFENEQSDPNFDADESASEEA